MVQRATGYGRHFLLLATAAFLFIVHFLFFHSGYFGFDEMEYARMAASLVQGNWDPGLNLYAYRWGVVLPLAGLYQLFGIGDVANMLLTLLTLLAILLLMLDLVRHFSLLEKMLLTAVVVCMPLHLMYLTKPMPDILVALGVLLCFYGYMKTNIAAPGAKPATAVILFASGAILAFLAKETFLIFYPLFLVIFLRDLFRRQHLPFWKYVASSLFAFLVLYFGYFYLTEGRPFVRVEALFHERYIDKCTYQLQAFTVVLKRIGYELLLAFIRSGALLPIGFVVLLRKRYHLGKVAQWSIFTYLALLFLANFMTISYTDYVPLCDDPRHFMFVLPFAAIVLALGLRHIKALTHLDRAVVVLAVGAQLAVSLYFSYEHTYWLYVPLILAIALGKVVPKYASALLMMMGLLSIYCQQATYNLEVNHSAQKELIEYVLQKDTASLVVTDVVNARIGNFYAGYDSAHQFVKYGKWHTAAHDTARPSYLISNGMTAYFSNINWEEVPEEFKNPDAHFERVYSNELGGVYVMPPAKGPVKIYQQEDHVEP
jgi:hypothetical protein